LLLTLGTTPNLAIDGLGDGPYNINDGGSGGGGSSSGPTPPSANVSKVAQKSSLGSEPMQKLNEAMDELLNDCVYGDMYTYITSKGVKFTDVIINSNAAQSRI